MAAVTVTVFLDADEITAESFTVDVRRGRSLETEDFDAGGGTVKAHNYEANFNPYFLIDTASLLQENDDFLLLESGDRILLEFGNGSGSGVYGEILLGRTITVYDGAVLVFTGFVEDYDYEWDAGGRCEVTLVVRDSFATLGATTFLEWTTTEGQLTGARVSAVLDRAEVGFPSGGSARDIDTGTQPLQADLVSYGSNVLSYLQKVNKSENGRLFVDRSGVLTFQDRYASFGLAASAAFDDAGNDIPFSSIEARFGTELLHFKVSVDREDGIAQTATNAGQIAAYPSLGVRHLTIGGMLYQSDDHSLGLAEFLLGRYSTIGAVVSGLTVKLHGLGSSDRAVVAALDVGDVVSLSWTPPGTTGVVFQTLSIESVGYSTDRSKRAEMTFQLSESSDPDYFQVDTDAVDGPALLAP